MKALCSAKAVLPTVAMSGDLPRSKRPTRTPHSGYHYDQLPRRFFEGWYFRITIPQENNSFAWMYSVEDPHPLLSGRDSRGVGAQIMGPSDKYLCQYSKDIDSFWASSSELELGSAFSIVPGTSSAPKSIVSSEVAVKDQEFKNKVRAGFQVSPYQHQGKLEDSGISRSFGNIIPTCQWEYEVVPLDGWGDRIATQKATAGWLAALPAFEPHWQVLMALGKASGYVKWGEEEFVFEDVPAYSEKNWGGSFPRKWFWIQCNAFENHPTLSVTAAGGCRQLPLSPFGNEENVAMIGVHYDGIFYELDPSKGEVSWNVTPWGSWTIKAVTESYFAIIEARCKEDVGTVLRAPTEEGLKPFCKDSFDAECTLSLWKVEQGKKFAVFEEATSKVAAVEVGGEGWWDAWKYTARMDDPYKSLVSLPLNLDSIFDNVLDPLRPPGL